MMADDARGEVTELLGRLGGDDRTAVYERLLPLVYDELHRLAAAYFRRERAGHTLQPTALVNEAYLILVDQRASFESRGHFLAIAATAMRRILVNHTRDRERQKRNGHRRCKNLGDAGMIATDAVDTDVLALNEAMDELATRDERKVRVVEMRYFAGLTIEEIATALAISERTVKREWQVARAWLRGAMEM